MAYDNNPDPNVIGRAVLLWTVGGAVAFALVAYLLVS
jgi:hypothetical protein